LLLHKQLFIVIQAEVSGDKWTKLLPEWTKLLQESPRILIHLPDMMFKKEWGKMFLQHIAEEFRKRGLKRQQAKEAARQVIDEWKKFGGFRMKA
jgi:hypothetical protein